MGEVADQAIHAVGVAACERVDAAGDHAKLDEADRARVAPPAPRQAAARPSTARLVAKVAVALTSSSRTVATCVTARIATYIATYIAASVGVGVRPIGARPIRPIGSATTVTVGNPRTRVHQSHHLNALANGRLACMTGTMPSSPLPLHCPDKPLLEAARPVATEVVGRRHPILEPLIHGAQRLAAQPHKMCPRHVAVIAREIGEAVRVCRPRYQVVGVGGELQRIGDERAKEPRELVIDEHAARRKERTIPQVLLRPPAHHLADRQRQQAATAANAELAHQQQRST